MKVFILIILSVALCNLAKAQYINDSSAVILTKKVPLKNIFTKKFIRYATPGDTVYLMNIRSKPYFYIKIKNEDAVVLGSDLDSSININAAIDFNHRLVKRIEKYIKLYGSKFGPFVMDKEVKIGMNETMILDIKGHPTKVYTTNYSFGVFEQWVYRNTILNNEYYYFKNGKLTSWQE